MSNKTAIVLFNLGGPDSQKNVRPFLLRLFSDKAILDLPWPLRRLLAELISRTREKQAQNSYARIGGRSPIVEESQKQAKALELLLQKRDPQGKNKCFVCMRYTEPGINTVQEKIRKWGADKTLLLPLYPQYSDTTTGSFFNAWEKKNRSERPLIKIRSYEEEKSFIQAHVKKILASVKKTNPKQNLRVIYSAHGLPEKMILAGDPYQQQIEKTCAAITRCLPATLKDVQIAYQSRVGRLKWIGPPTLDEIIRAGQDGKTALVVPVAFVSEHVETLVELDIDYQNENKKSGGKALIRVPALGIEPDYINCLADLVMQALKEKQ